jgi:hypothetical protein
MNGKRDEDARHRTIRGEPKLLTSAAASLRSSPVGRRDGAPLPGAFVMLGIARLLDALAGAMRGPHGLPPEVVSAAEDLAQHALTYLQTGEPGKDDRG